MLFVLFSWLCVLLTTVVVISWLHTPVRTPGLDTNVRVVCFGLLACSVAWLLMHFVSADTEARWTDELVRVRLPVRLNASDPLQTLKAVPLRTLWQVLRTTLAAVNATARNETARNERNETARHETARNETARWR
jgi:hypothetical protein